MARFTYEGGRQIYYNGRPFISIGREGNTPPAAADEVCKVIVRALNKSNAAKRLGHGHVITDGRRRSRKED